MEQSIKDLVKEISVLEIKPNQALLLKFNMSLQPDVIKQFRDSLIDYLGCKVVIIDNNIDTSVIEVRNEDNNN